MRDYSSVAALVVCCTGNNINIAKNTMLLQRRMLLHISSTRMFKRHSWTKEEDEAILRLVYEKGNAWTEIASKLGVKGSSIKVKRRWENLQVKCKSFWTKVEDNDLEQAVNKYIATGRDLGHRGSWIAIANMLEASRTPHQCFTRWTRALLPLQGIAVNFTRFENVRGWRWMDDEVARLLAAIASVTSVKESNETIKVAERDEPWLLEVHEAEAQRVPQYWMYIASKVGTRSANQCSIKWNWMNGNKAASKLSIDEAKRLIQLIKIHGTRWTLLKREYFPSREPRELVYIYNRWKQAERELGVDFLDIDPLPMLKELKGILALRTTGKDGKYDPNGKLIRVSLGSKPSIFTPYYLALQNVSKLRAKQEIGSRRSGTYNKDRRHISPEIIEKLFKAVAAHKNDWISISRDVGISIKKCRKYAEMLGSSIVSIREAISDSELDKLSKKASRPVQSSSKKIK